MGILLFLFYRKGNLGLDDLYLFYKVNGFEFRVFLLEFIFMNIVLSELEILFWEVEF